MAFRLTKSRNSPPSKSTQLCSFLAGNGGLFLGGAGVHSSGQIPLRRRRRIQGEQVYGSSLPLRFLLNVFTHCSFHRSHCQIPSLLPHPTSLPPLQKGLPLTRRRNIVLCVKPDSSLRFLNQFRPFCKNVDSEDESEGEDESGFVGNVGFEVDREEVERVCKVIDETFAIDRNMEVVLDECGIDLSHELVLAVLERFKHARKPAFRFFSWAAERPDFVHDSRTYNSMMTVLGKTRQLETMVSILEEMGGKGLLRMETFIICIRAFAAAKERKKAVAIFDLMKKYNFKVGAETINCLLDELGKAKLGKEAQALFEKLEHKFSPDLKTFTILLNGWCVVKNFVEAGMTWNVMIDKGFKPDIVAHNIMLEGLLRGHKRSDAIKLFEVMKCKGPPPNVRSYTILIRYLCKHGKMDETMEYMNDMLSSGCEPDVALYTCLMTGFANRKKMDMVYSLLKEMKEKGCPPDGRMYNALIKMMANQKMPDEAVKIYKKMIQSGIEPSIHTYNMIMKAYFVARNYEMGCAVWEEMKRKGFCPDENSYGVFIGGLVRQGRSNEACKCLEEMMDKGMKVAEIDRLNILGDLGQKMKFSGNSEVADLFGRWLR